eukprot:gb/GECG01001443.1/.p1 GENE.gb/GECG01001443.1/~~gb/GECG01001443.1/.p1  ORF type:complete len:358 (+),score=31.43 gb/GECG01001443.1/:1-1074(+)
MEEKRESSESLGEKISHLVDLIRSSRRVVVHTGAGISTGCGIPDFRGPQGVWTLRDQGKKLPRRPPFPIYPSKAHMAVVELVQQEVVNYVVSQNTDGLHVMSGIPFNKISELHGNKHRERCSNPRCGQSYYRDYPCRRRANAVHDHKTGRKCEKCGSELHDSIVNFGENLPEDDIERAIRESKNADLCIVLGTSLKVYPAAGIPLERYPTCKLAIVNLQETPVDDKAHVRMFGTCDDVMERLMAKLGYSIPPFIARTTLKFSMQHGNHITMDVNIPDLIRSVELSSAVPLVKEPGKLRWTLRQSRNSLDCDATIHFLDQKKLQPLKMKVRLEKDTTSEFPIKYNVHDPRGDSWTLDA